VPKGGKIDLLSPEVIKTSELASKQARDMFLTRMEARRFVSDVISVAHGLDSEMILTGTRNQ
jgi:hypothetical protein